jgi:hypothetical protein
MIAPPAVNHGFRQRDIKDKSVFVRCKSVHRSIMKLVNTRIQGVQLSRLLVTETRFENAKIKVSPSRYT